MGHRWRLKPFFEGGAKDTKYKSFAMKALCKYFRTDDRDVRRGYEAVIKSVFNLPTPLS
jgi:hypothetical protein